MLDNFLKAARLLFFILISQCQRQRATDKIYVSSREEVQCSNHYHELDRLRTSSLSVNTYIEELDIA